MRGKVGTCNVCLLLVLLAVLGGERVRAQETATPPSGDASSPSGGGAREGRGLRIVPRLDTVLTWTDEAGGALRKDSGWIYELSPGLRVSSTRGRFVGLFDAQWRNVGHARDGGRGQSFGVLHGAGELEAVRETFFLDFGAAIDRDNRSPFAGRAGDDSLNIARDDEVRGWSLGSRLQFRLGNAAEGAIRYRSNWLDSNLDGFIGQRQQLWAGQIGNRMATRYAGWNLEYAHYDTDYDSARETFRRDLGRVTIFLDLARQFRLRATAGYESHDSGVVGGRDEGAFGGGGFDWYPTPRTTVSLLAERRAFGGGYDFRFSHRTRRALWEISGVRDIASSADSFSVYQDPVFLSHFNSPGLVAQFPDSVQREQVVRLLLGDAPGGDVVTNAYYHDRRWRAGAVFIGLRNSLALSGQRSRRRLLSSTGGAGYDGFAGSNWIDTDSATLAFSRRLAPRALLGATITRSRSQAGGDLDTWRTSASLGVNARLGPQTQAGLTYRHQRADSELPEGDYTENSLRANLGLSF